MKPLNRRILALCCAALSSIACSKNQSSMSPPTDNPTGGMKPGMTGGMDGGIVGGSDISPTGGMDGGIVGGSDISPTGGMDGNLPGGNDEPPENAPTSPQLKSAIGSDPSVVISGGEMKSTAYKLRFGISAVPNAHANQQP